MNTEILEKNNDLEIITNDNFIVIYNKVTKEVSIKSNIKLNIDFCTDLSLNIDGKLDINVANDININTNKEFFINSKILWLNSENKKQIYDVNFNNKILGVK